MQSAMYGMQSTIYRMQSTIRVCIHVQEQIFAPKPFSLSHTHIRHIQWSTRDLAYTWRGLSL